MRARTQAHPITLVVFPLLLAAALTGASVRAADAPTPTLMLDVWPGPPPGETAPVAPEKTVESGGIHRTSDVSKPTLAVYRPPKEKDTGAAVVIAPGGGYSILAIDLEGEEVAAWLNSLGVTGIVLKYRVPQRAADPGHLLPLMDAQRAVSLVRSKAKEWGIDPGRIGMLGFSAGGHLTTHAITNSDHRAYEAKDDVDQVSCRPDFAILIYPAYLLTKDNESLAPEIRVSKETPPTFLAHAGDDPITVESSVRLYLALKRAGVPAELHVYEKGGHGYGLRPSANAVSTWPKRCEEWLRSRGLLSAAK